MKCKSNYLNSVLLLLVAVTIFISPVLSFNGNQQLSIAQAKKGAKLVIPKNIKVNDITAATKTMQNKTFKTTKKLDMKMYLTKNVRTNTMAKGQKFNVLSFIKYKNVTYAYVWVVNSKKGKLREGYINAAYLIED